MDAKRFKNAKFGTHINVKYQLRDKDGNLKKMFHPYPWIRTLVKKGLLSPLHPQNIIFGKFNYSPLRVANLITSAGLAGLASRINGSGAEAAFTYIAVGTGTTAANASDTTLETEITDSGLARANATASRTTTDVSNDTARLQQTFSVTGTKAVTESGVLNAGASGTLLAREVFSAVNVINGDSLQVTWDFDVDTA